MKIKLTCLVGVLLLPFSVVAQKIAESKTEENRKGKLFFFVGAEYRLGIHFNDYDRDWIGRGIDEEDLNRGAAFSYHLDYFLTQNFSIGFSHSFRYDYAHAGSTWTSLNNLSDGEVISAHYDLLMDYHLYAKHHFRLFQEDFFFQAGVSFLNNGPPLLRNPRTISNSSGSTLESLNLEGNDITNRFSIGYQKNRFRLQGGVYYSSKNENPFYLGSSYTVPFLEFKYQLGNLLKKKE